MQTLILADNQDVTRYGMKAIAAGLYPGQRKNLRDLLFRHKF